MKGEPQVMLKGVKLLPGISLFCALAVSAWPQGSGNRFPRFEDYTAQSRASNPEQRFEAAVVKRYDHRNDRNIPELGVERSRLSQGLRKAG